ncbi:MAG TPA: DUF4381 domain-containing protein [Burkholderiales bacterium]
MNLDFELAVRLKDAHPPEAPPWWPLAPGWWLVVLGALLAAALLARALRPRLERRRLRRRLLAALEAIAAGHRAGAADADTAAEVSQLLRRAALARFPERNAAGLQGGEWLAFLESCDSAPGRFAALREALTVEPYAAPGAAAAQPQSGVAPLLEAARGWLRAAV